MRNEKLITAREDRGWTQEKAAEKIGISRVAYARWEEQGILPRLWTMNKAREVFHMTSEQLGFTKPSTLEKQLQVPFLQNISAVYETTDLFQAGIVTLLLSQQYYDWTIDELLSKAVQEIRRLEIMTQEQRPEEGKLSRRQLIGLLMSVPVAALGITQSNNAGLLSENEVLSLCAVNVPLAWQLYFAGGLTEVQQMLPTYLTKLSTMAQQLTQYQKQAAGLASQAHQLGYLLALQNQNFSVAQGHTKHALYYAELANDANLRMTSLIRQGNLFFTLKRPVQTMQKYQEALHMQKNNSPLLIGQAYIGLAEVQARLGDKKEAERLQRLAQETFPENPEEDLHFSYTHFNHFTRVNFEGLMYLHLDQPQNAWTSFALIDKNISSALTPQRVELLSRQALTSVALGDLEQSCTYIELAGMAALKFGSHLRYSETCDTYAKMQQKWRDEKSVKALEELFSKEV